MSHLHHVTMATLHQQQLMKGARERERVKKEAESTMCWHVALELSELKQ